MRIVRSPGGKRIDSKNLHVYLSGYLGKDSLILLLMVMNFVPAVVQSNCPLLRGFINDTGILIVNKTAMMGLESTIHCQWLVVGSVRQVRVLSEQFA